MGEFCNPCMEIKILWLSILYIWIDRKDLFKLSKLVFGARVIVTSLYGSLQEQGLWCKDNCKEFVGSLQGQGLWCKGNCNEFYGSLQGQGLW